MRRWVGRSPLQAWRRSLRLEQSVARRRLGKPSRRPLYNSRSTKTLNVDIKNDRDESILLTSNAEFYLSPTDTTEKESVFAYWSPVDPRTCAIRQPNEPGSSIRISPKGRGRCVFPPDALRWAKEIAAVWPDERLAKVVPPVLTFSASAWASWSRTKSGCMFITLDSSFLSSDLDALSVKLIFQT
jgi:hypothetical protein